MIVGTHFGLFMPALRPDWEKLPSGEPELQIRSRRKVDLLNLRQFMIAHDLYIGEPFAIPRTDYQWRAYTTRTMWGEALAFMADDIDYTKFKDTPMKKHGDNRLTDAYSAIWSATLRSFPTGSIYTNPSKGSRQVQVHPRQGGKIAWQDRVAETVYRTENREWRMSGASPETLAKLMKEIDSATADVVIPSEDELERVRRDVERQPLWMQKEILTPVAMTGPTEINGRLDHTKCQHNGTPNARRKCRKRFYGRS
jgi:hypothetical protein